MKDVGENARSAADLRESGSGGIRPAGRAERGLGGIHQELQRGQDGQPDIFGVLP
jgi:hypothetical protein